MTQFGRIPMQRLTDAERDSLLSIAKQEDMQDYIIFGLALEGFMRVSEVLSLRAGDILPDGRVVIHRKKKSITNVLPIRNEDVLVAVNWLLTHRPRKGDLLFNRPRRTLDWRMKEYGRKVGIPAEKCHMHALKHTACQTALNESGGNIMVTKTLAGHASITSTLQYVGMTQEEALALRTPKVEPKPKAMAWGAGAGGD